MLQPKPQPDPPQPSEDLQATIRLLARLARESFYGKVEVSFLQGRIVHIRKEENLKPESLPKSS